MPRSRRQSRKTGYKWVGRFKEGGRPAPKTTGPSVGDRTRRRRRATLWSSWWVHENAIQTWGPRKLQAWLVGRGWECPSASTVGAILEARGLRGSGGEAATDGRIFGRPLGAGLAECGVGCGLQGLVLVEHGRQVLSSAHGSPTDTVGTSCGATLWRILMRKLAVSRSTDLFKEHGLLRVLRTDNGTPFSGRFGVSSAVRLVGEVSVHHARAHPTRKTNPEWPA